MTTPIPMSPVPYVTPAMLTSAPTGIDWSSIPPGRTTTQAAKTAELLNICQRASADADGLTNQVLRATQDTETVYGPDYYVTQEPNGNTRIVTSRFPVLSVVQVQVCPATQFPRVWTALPAGYAEPESPVIGIYGASQPAGTGEGSQRIVMAPGYVDWSNGRRGWAIQVTYLNGWPHTVLTSDVSVGATTLPVYDTTGWGPLTAGGPGASGVIYDGASQEVAKVTAASVTAGPGNLTLAVPLQFAHTAGTLISTLPGDAVWATMLLATAEALTRGATSTTVQTIPGGSGSSEGPRGIDGLRAIAYRLLSPFRRVI